jgi:hypothetical protein
MAAHEILRDDEGREVVKFTTPGGVTACVATCIPEAALKGLARKLERSIRERERREAKRVLSGGSRNDSYRG